MQDPSSLEKDSVDGRQSLRQRLSSHAKTIIIGSVILVTFIVILIPAAIAFYPDHPTTARTSNSIELRATIPYTGRWKTGDTWQIQLTDKMDPAKAQKQYKHYDIDLFDNSAATVSALKKKNHTVICYFSAGSYEAWRPDAKKFPKFAKGAKMDGWDELWIDTRNKALRKVMAARIKLAKDKGCDAVDPDNIDGYGNKSGFPLTTKTAIDYVNFLSRTAHNLGLGCGLKNGGDIVKSVIKDVDFQVNEECVINKECSQLKPFIDAKKAVFHLEYAEDSPAKKSFVDATCNDPTTKGFSTLIKHLDLNAWTTTCPKPKPSSYAQPTKTPATTDSSMTSGGKFAMPSDQATKQDSSMSSGGKFAMPEDQSTQDPSLSSGGKFAMPDQSVKST